MTEVESPPPPPPLTRMQTEGLEKLWLSTTRPSTEEIRCDCQSIPSLLSCWCPGVCSRYITCQKDVPSSGLSKKENEIAEKRNTEVNHKNIGASANPTLHGSCSGIQMTVVGQCVFDIVPKIIISLEIRGKLAMTSTTKCKRSILVQQRQSRSGRHPNSTTSSGAVERTSYVAAIPLTGEA